MPESGQLFCVYIGLWTARDDDVTLRFFQITLVKILAPVQRKKVNFFFEENGNSEAYAVFLLLSTNTC